MQDADPEGAPPRRTKTTNVLLAVLVMVVVTFALKETASVTLPLAFAIFLIALHWPLQRRLTKVLPRGLAVVISVLVFAAVVSGFTWALLESADEVKDNAHKYQPQLEETVSSVRAWLAERGVEVGAAGGSDLIKGFAKSGSRALFDFIGGAVLVIAFLGLGLLEVPSFKRKLETSTSSRRGNEHWPSVVRRIGTQFQRYVVVRTGIGAITGVGCGAGAAIIGLDFWYIWGILNFLLNYIPTLGSIIGVVPPTLFALFQGGPEFALLTLAVVGGVQLVMGNWIDPLLQGKYLQLSPLVVLVSVTFWGWVWGIPGALIGVPLTIGVVLITREFDSTRWIAMMLADTPEPEPEASDDSQGDERDRAESRAPSEQNAE